MAYKVHFLPRIKHDKVMNGVEVVQGGENYERKLHKALAIQVKVCYMGNSSRRYWTFSSNILYKGDGLFFSVRRELIFQRKFRLNFLLVPGDAWGLGTLIYVLTLENLRLVELRHNSCTQLISKRCDYCRQGTCTNVITVETSRGGQAGGKSHLFTQLPWNPEACLCILYSSISARRSFMQLPWELQSLVYFIYNLCFGEEILCCVVSCHLVEFRGTPTLGLVTSPALCWRSMTLQRGNETGQFM